MRDLINKRTELKGFRSTDFFIGKRVADRFYLFDKVRGLTLISMVLFHSYWDLVYLIGMKTPLRGGQIEYLWQQSICWTFIFLSGLCMNLSKDGWKRGSQILGASVLVTLVTLIVIPENRIVFGVLTMLGSAMLIGTAARKFTEKVPALAGFLANAVLFVLTKPVMYGYLGLLDKRIWKVPEFLYNGYLATYFGFADPQFSSADYFPLMPWIFLFFCGYFLGRILNVKDKAAEESAKNERKGIPVLSWLGQNSLFVYLIHQPVLYIFVMLLGGSS